MPFMLVWAAALPPEVLLAMPFMLMGGGLMAVPTSSGGFIDDDGNTSSSPGFIDDDGNISFNFVDDDGNTG